MAQQGCCDFADRGRLFLPGLFLFMSRGLGGGGSLDAGLVLLPDGRNTRLGHLRLLWVNVPGLAGLRMFVIKNIA